MVWVLIILTGIQLCWSSNVIRVVMGHLNTDKAASLHEAFPVEQAHDLARRLKFHYTKHGSWLNIAEIELAQIKMPFVAKLKPMWKSVIWKPALSMGASLHKALDESCFGFILALQNDWLLIWCNDYRRLKPNNLSLSIKINSRKRRFTASLQLIGLNLIKSAQLRVIHCFIRYRKLSSFASRTTKNPA